MSDTFNELSEERKSEALALASIIDETDSISIIRFGEAAQDGLNKFSKMTSKKMTSYDVAGVNRSYNELIEKVKETDNKNLSLAPPTFFQKLFNTEVSIYETIAKYQRINVQVERISIKLNREIEEMVSSNEMLNDLFDENLVHYENISTHIAAGELKLNDLNESTLPKMREVVKQSRNEMDKQRLHDLEEFTNRLERRIYDLKIARQISVQQAPQIRMIQQTNQTLAEKMQNSVNVVIPLWMTQISISIALLKQRRALDTQMEASNLTNQFLIENTDEINSTLRENMLALQSGKVDKKKMKAANKELIKQLEDVKSFNELTEDKVISANDQLEIDLNRELELLKKRETDGIE